MKNQWNYAELPISNLRLLQAVVHAVNLKPRVGVNIAAKPATNTRVKPCTDAEVDAHQTRINANVGRVEDEECIQVMYLDLAFLIKIYHFLYC